MQLTGFLIVLATVAGVFVSARPKECNDMQLLHAGHGHNFWGCDVKAKAPGGAAKGKAAVVDKEHACMCYAFYAFNILVIGNANDHDRENFTTCY
jgi:hypothetical protein